MMNHRIAFKKSPILFPKNIVANVFMIHFSHTNENQIEIHFSCFWALKLNVSIVLFMQLFDCTLNIYINVLETGFSSQMI